jgi:primosomal protein N'
MGDVLNFKCPCCGAKLTFSGKTEEMTCEYCDASFSIEQAKAAQEAEEQDAASSSMTWTTTEKLLIQDEMVK